MEIRLSCLLFHEGTFKTHPICVTPGLLWDLIRAHSCSTDPSEVLLRSASFCISLANCSQCPHPSCCFHGGKQPGADPSPAELGSVLLRCQLQEERGLVPPGGSWVLPALVPCGMPGQGPLVPHPRHTGNPRGLRGAVGSAPWQG